MKPTLVIDISAIPNIPCGKTQLQKHIVGLLEKHPFQPKGFPVSPDILVNDRDLTSKVPAEPVSPPPPAPLVPLGENVTRDGRKARVICIDLAGQGKKVIAAVAGRVKPEYEVTSFHYEDGRVNLNGIPDPGDLVGHLPSEPMKPREVWIAGLSPTSITWELKNPGDGKHVLFREVFPGEADELEALRRWKKGMLTLIEGIPLHEIGKEIPGLTLGDRIGPAILPYIRTLKHFIGDLRQPHVSAQVERDAANLLEP